MIDSRGAECVASRQHHGLAVTRELVREFADRGRLARAVDAHYQDHMGLRGFVERERRSDRIEHARYLGGQNVAHIVFRNALLVTTLRQHLANPVRHGEAEIGLDQDLFELFERIVVELALGQNAGEVFRKGGRRPGHAGLEPREPSLFFRRRFVAAHRKASASNATPSSPETTQSRSAPALAAQGSGCNVSSGALSRRTGVKSAERPCVSSSSRTWI